MKCKGETFSSGSLPGEAFSSGSLPADGDD